MSPHFVAEVGTQGLVAGFLMGETGACPLVGGADSYPSGGWGFVSGVIRDGMCLGGGL